MSDKRHERRSRRRNWLEGQRSQSPDALIECVQLVGLQRPPLEHLDHSRLDAGKAYKHAQVKGQHATEGDAEKFIGLHCCRFVTDDEELSLFSRNYSQPVSQSVSQTSATSDQAGWQEVARLPPTLPAKTSCRPVWRKPSGSSCRRPELLSRKKHVASARRKGRSLRRHWSTFRFFFFF